MREKWFIVLAVALSFSMAAHADYYREWVDETGYKHLEILPEQPRPPRDLGAYTLEDAAEIQVMIDAREREAFNDAVNHEASRTGKSREEVIRNMFNRK